MRFHCLWVLALFLPAAVTCAAEQDANVDNAAAPIPKLDADGPTSFVTGLAFSPDGQTLYAAGWDKIIRVWRRDAREQFTLDPAATFRVPIGPGPAGQLNAIAVSSNGRLLAAGGNAAFRHGSTFDRPGLIVPAIGAMDREMREDQGTIFIFDVRTREVRQLRGHQGAVVALEFAAGGPLLLASAGQEWDEQAKVRRGAVRLWDLAEGKAVASTNRLPEPKTRPSLAVVTPTASSRPTRLPTVAIAWGDERFSLWNPNTDQLQTASDSRYNNTLAQAPGVGIVTGSASGLKIWQTAEPPAIRSRFEQVFGRAIPRAMTIASSKGDRNFDGVAVVAREPGSEEDRLYLVNPRTGQLFAQPIGLWNGRGTQPAIAASAAGDLAVAGGRDYRIVVYHAADIRQNRASRQVLNSSGESVRVATIARQGERYGLVLSSTPKDQPGQVRARLLESDRVFDVGAKEFAGDRRGWNVDVPDAARWSVRHEAPPGAEQRTVLSVSDGGRVASRIELGPRQQLSDYALLPPRAPYNRPLLAVAYFDFESGQPVLAMFDAASGDRFREYLGHTGRITSVAFSRDGRFLVTAAEDQTTCLWTLADLDQVLGVRGQLTGLKVDTLKGKDGGTQLLVAHAEPALATAGLAPGDLLAGLVSGDDVQSFDTVRALYESISLMKPGARATLRRLRGAHDEKDVNVVVGQGIDERKPLFTFFTSRAEGRRAAQWIGWSPLGPYDSSDPAVEKLLGWHFNTGQAEAPVSFASVDQYRARFATKGLLLKLLETGQPQLPAPREPDPPAMSLWLEQTDKEPLALEPGTSVVVHKGPAALEASSGPFAADQVESIGWRIGDESGAFQSANGQWRADLTGISWKRGSYSVQVGLKTKPPHRELKQVLTLVYQPSPPEAKSKLPPRSETSNEQFEFQAEVVPSTAGETFRAALTHQHGTDDPTVVREVSSREPWSVREKVPLRPGVNLLKLVAENDHAMVDRADNERTIASFEVYYNPPKIIPAPRIELAELVLRAADGAEEARRVGSEGTVVVNTPRVVLRGTVRGSEELAVAQYRAEANGESTAISGFVANKAKSFAFEQRLTLQPGMNRLSLEAKSATSEMTERPLYLDYHPQLPTLTATSLPQRVFEPQYSFVADLTPPVDSQPYQVDVYLNEQPLPNEKVALDEGRIRALATLRPGDNRLELRLSNKWGAEPVVQALGVEYIHPPKILTLASDRQKDPDAIVMHLRVESERRPEAAVVQVNGKPQQLEFDAKATDRADQWELNFKPLLLEPGESRVNVSVKNEQAESLRRELVVNVEKRALPPPEIVVLSDHNHAVLPDSKVPVEVVIRSTSPIQDVEVSGSNKLLHTASDLTRQKRNEQGFYEYFLKTVLASGSDPELWRVEAVNRGGRKAVDIPNVVIVPPASVVLESIALRAKRDRRFPLTKSATGELALEKELPESELVLSGYVVASPGTADETRQIPVQVWVNGFLQKPVLAGVLQPESRRRPFQAEFVLTRRENNRIEVGIMDPDLPSDAGNRTAFVVNCSKPMTARRLHLLVVAVGAKREEGAEVRKRAVAAVQGTVKTPREFVAPAFEQGIIHEVLLGSAVQRNKVLFEIGRLARNLRPNDVAMIYYQGNVREADDTFYLTTSATKSLADPKQTEIGRDELNRWFGNMAGAQLILLDVDRAATPEQATLAKNDVKARWPADSHIAFFRFAWAAPEPRNTPDEPVLLTAWEQSARKSRTLAQIDSGLESFSTTASGRYPQKIVYEKHLPTGLDNLEFGLVSEAP